MKNPPVARIQRRFAEAGAWARGGVAFAVGLAAVVACSAGPAKTDALSTSLFPQAYAQALCGSLRHCCDENNVAFVEAECTAGWKDFAAARLADPLLAANYDSRVAQECVRAVRAAESVTCDPVPGSISSARATCQRIFAGKKPLGSPCTSSAECEQTPGTTVGCEGMPLVSADAGLLPLSAVGLRPLANPIGPPKCVVIPPPQPGDRCTTPALVAFCESVPDLACDQVEGVCKALANAGQPCKPGGCKAGLYCAAGLCSPRVGVGEECTANEQCGGISRCDLGLRRCVERRTSEDSCEVDAECLIGTCDPLTKRCLKNAIATSATCAGRSTEP